MIENNFNKNRFRLRILDCLYLSLWENFCHASGFASSLSPAWITTYRARRTRISIPTTQPYFLRRSAQVNRNGRKAVKPYTAGVF